MPLLNQELSMREMGAGKVMKADKVLYICGICPQLDLTGSADGVIHQRL